MMLRIRKRHSKKAGTSPVTLIHIGEKKTEDTRITLIDFDEAFPLKDLPTVTWINIDGLHDVEFIKRIGENFGIHPLILTVS